MSVSLSTGSIGQHDTASINTTTTASNNNSRAGSPIPTAATLSPPIIALTSSTSSTSSNNSMPSIPFNRTFSPIEYKNLRFLVLDCPTTNTLHLYLKEMQSRGVTDVVRVCEPTYPKVPLEDNGIQVHDWPFKDGGIPPNQIVLQFLGLCEERFGGIISPAAPTAAAATATATSASPEGSPDGKAKEANGPVIAVHCVAGLGRAPVLVALALIEAGMSPLDTIEFVRRRRRGAFNSVQLSFLLDSYKRQWSKKSGKLGFKTNKRASSPASPKDGKDNGGSNSAAGGAAGAG
ncbi:Protein tyrosine phosphatase type IVA 2, partial [Quaeritorhiza haematococci]